MNIFQQLFGGGPSVDLAGIIKDGAFLVDVRTPGEFASGHAKGSVNIPLDQLPAQLSKFKNKKNIMFAAKAAAGVARRKRFSKKTDLRTYPTAETGIM